MMKRIFFLIGLSVVLGVAACSDDDFSTSENDALTFSADTLKMDTVFSTVPSSTYGFWVYNRSQHALRIGNVALEDEESGFRVNVDGSFLQPVASDIEIRKGDSAYVFVELTAAPTGREGIVPLRNRLQFQLASGKRQHVTLQAWQWDADIKEWWNVDSDTSVEEGRPIVVMRGLRVGDQATLKLNRCQLFFHDGAKCEVAGRIEAQHTVFRGDRLDNMLSQLPYDRVSGQWAGISLEENARGSWTNCDIRNAVNALVCREGSEVTLHGTRIHNSKGHGIDANHAQLDISLCQLTNAAGCCLLARGGRVEMTQTTLAQFYPFDANRGEAFRVEQAEVECSNTLITGYGDDELWTEGDQLMFQRCIIRKTLALPSEQQQEVTWENGEWKTEGKDHFVLVDETRQQYDFTLSPESPARQLGIGCLWQGPNDSEYGK